MPRRLPSGSPTPPDTGYRLSAWLGGTANSWAEVVVRFMPAANRVLGCRVIVVSSIAGTVTPLAAASGRVGAPVSVGLYSYPTGMTLTGFTAVVLDTYAGQITLINTRTGRAFAPVTLGNYPVAVTVSG